MLLGLSQIQQAFDKVKISSDGRGYFDYDACKECKGKNCCQHFACVYEPQDFSAFQDIDTNREKVVSELLRQIQENQNISLDLILFNDHVWGPINAETKEPDKNKIDNADGFLMLRARCAGREIIDFQIFLEKEKNYPCINWSVEKGCCLSKDNRPFSGRMLKPVVFEGYPIERKYHCITSDEDYDFLTHEWAKYQDIMYDLYLKLKELEN